MRMWMVNPEMLCRKHLLGEHVETHMFVGSIRKGISIEGYVSRGLVETHNLKARHDALVQEMKRRGFNHKTPMDYQDDMHIGIVDKSNNVQELIKRCEECKKRYEEERTRATN